jgi:hypothetical protein
MRFADLSLTERVDWENQVLSSGRDCLPPFAVAVLDGEEATEEYWDWVAEQYAAAAQ